MMMEKINNSVIFNNLDIQVKVRYVFNKEQKKVKEWFISDFSFYDQESKQKKFLSQITIKFEHIDEDNPEFFLQPGQIIRINEGIIKLIDNISEKKNYILIIDKFKQLSEKERKDYQQKN